jgi:hypothetical protein
MEETKSYIVEISNVFGDDTTIYLESNGEPVESFYAVIGIAERGACVLDTCYRSVAEAQAAWPEAIPPKPYHLTPQATDHNCTIEGRNPSAKLRGDQES